MEGLEGNGEWRWAASAESERDELHSMVLFAASPTQERTSNMHCNPEGSATTAKRQASPSNQLLLLALQLRPTHSDPGPEQEKPVVSLGNQQEPHTNRNASMSAKSQLSFIQPASQ